MGENRIAAADHVTFHIEKGEFCIIVGPSGAGKTTVLNMLGGMDTCDEGHIWLDGKEVSAYNQRQLTEYRRYDVGFVFQFYNLVQNLTALENVELASEICKKSRCLRPKRCARWGWSTAWATSRRSFRAASSSAFPLPARWPKTQKILLCDEPTGALDYKTGKQVLALLQDTCRSTGRTVIVITHNSALTAMADRVIRIKSGQAISNVVNEHPTPVEEIEW